MLKVSREYDFVALAEDDALKLFLSSFPLNTHGFKMCRSRYFLLLICNLHDGVAEERNLQGATSQQKKFEFCLCATLQRNL